MNFNTAKDYLFELQFFGIKLGLEQVYGLLKHLGRPQDSLKFIHLAGTNGKGSTASMLSSALNEVGFKIGFYSSPHLVSVRERFRINGKAISEEAFTSLIEKLYPAIEKMKDENGCPTYFEVTTAMAACYFAEQNVDFVIWETGMGGRFDATNVINPICSVITGISMEHQSYLGDSIEKIAFEKAGIIKDSKPLFIGDLKNEADVVIRKQAAEKNAPVYPNNRIIEDEIALSLKGEIQKRNAALALNIIKWLSTVYLFDINQAILGFNKVKWPGRFQILPDENIVDGAHNPDGISALVNSVKKMFPGQRFAIIFGCFADKNTEPALRLLLEISSSFIFTPLATERESCTPDELSKIVKSFSDLKCKKVASSDDALQQVAGQQFIATGSLYLAGEILLNYFDEENIINLT